jgi:hypothetical protein
MFSYSVCIASVVRITTIHTVITSPDLTWAMGKLFIWSCCEPFIGIVCACLPTLAPFFRRWWTTLLTKSAGEDSSNTPAAESALSYPRKHSNSRSANKSTDDAFTGRADLRVSKREWSRLHGSGNGNIKLRNDDEVELTNNISGPTASMRTKSSDEEAGYQLKTITVKKDVSWSSTGLDDDASSG